MITALCLRVDNNDELFEYDARDPETLAILQEKVGGWLELAPIIDRTLSMYCNEEGKILGLPRNDRASDLLAPNNPDWIAGDVVLVGAPDSEGYDTSLPQVFIDAINEKR